MFTKDKYKSNRLFFDGFTDARIYLKMILISMDKNDCYCAPDIL